MAGTQQNSQDTWNGEEVLGFVRKVVEVELSGSGKVFESAADDILPARLLRNG